MSLQAGCALTNAEGRLITAQFEAKRAETDLLALSGTLVDQLLGR